MRVEADQPARRRPAGAHGEDVAGLEPDPGEEGRHLRDRRARWSADATFFDPEGSILKQNRA